MTRYSVPYITEVRVAKYATIEVNAVSPEQAIKKAEELRRADDFCQEDYIVADEELEVITDLTQEGTPEIID